MLRRVISILAMLVLAVWLAYPLVTPPTTSPTSVDYNVVAQTSNKGRTFVVRDTTVEPGGAIGWHWHPGTVIAIVKQGILHHYRSDCTVDAVYRPGEAFTEPSGPDNVHDGRNFGTTPLVLEVVYVVRSGEPLAEAQELLDGCR